ncbi:MAG: succinate dehydrogenase, cytochrome b556 subunit [Gammaproteobacteria bacterium]|nr:succinate dehydrogenase, cytochrome b556 subunit [Gammaproteobacteria bacterium]
MDNNKIRPKHLNLFKIHMPVTAMVSIAHRAAGILLVILIPVVIYLLQRSLQSAQAYDAVMQLLTQPLAKILLVIAVWGGSHHFFAGMRFLLIDIDIGILKSSARRSAWLVHLLALVSALWLAAVLL